MKLLIKSNFESKKTLILKNLILLVFIFLFIKLIKLIYFQTMWPHDWEPTDGDHLNFSQRLHENKAIYSNPEKGYVLSLYNPLFHMIIDYTTNGNASFLEARLIVLAYFLTYLSILLYFTSKNMNKIFKISLIFLIIFPPIPDLILDLIQITPTSLLGLMFLITGLFVEKYHNSGKIIHIFVISVFCIFTFLVKQQGIILIPTVFVFYLLKTNLRKYLITFTFFIVIIYLAFLIIFNSQLAENYNIFKATLVDPKNILITYWKLGVLRFLQSFIILLPLLILVYVSKFKNIKNLKKINFWELSVLLHAPFLLYILQNGAGGANYFFTFWISLVMVFILYFNDFETFKSNERNRLLSPATYFSVISLLIFSAAVNYHSIERVKYPKDDIAQNMTQMIDKISFYTKNFTNCTALANRNIGVLLNSHCDITMEGSATFQSAWNSKNVLNKSFVLGKIKCKQYNIILTGIQHYPPEVEDLIEKNYNLVYSTEVNFYFGSTGLQSLYIPNTEVSECDQI